MREKSGKRNEILLIEDNPGDARLIREMVKEVDGGRFDVEVADRLAAGLERLKQKGRDIILLDLGLPDSQGLETFTKVCAQAKGVPVVVLTGLDDESLGIEALRHGAQDYLIKEQIFGKGGVLRRAISYAIERKKAEEEVRQKAKDLQEKNDEMTRFTAAVLHNLRSPLITIQTFQGYLEQDIRRQDAARIEKDLGYIRNAADKIGRLIDELLRLSRVGRIINPFEDAPLQAIVQEALDLVAGRITGRGVRVDITEEPVVLWGDRMRLVEVFQNLVENAVKFMGDEPAPRLEIGVEQAGEEMVLYVRDNGIGIDPQVQPMLFGLFQKLDPETEGMGIGLSLVRRIVEAHGGRIWVESGGPGKGATFRFTLAKTRRQRAEETPPKLKGGAR